MTQQKERWLQIEISLPAELSEAVTNFLMENGAQGVFQEEAPEPQGGGFAEDVSREALKAYLPDDVRVENRLTSLQNYLDELGRLFPDLPRPSWRTDWIVDPNWGEEWKKYFKPLRVTKNIIIKPTWERYSPGGHDILIEIDPGMAFGTCTHPTTQLCLITAEDLLADWPAVDVLDLGCGSGILGIAAIKLGARHVLALDTDPLAVTATQENAARNGVASQITALQGSLDTLRGSPRHFDLMLVNILAKVIIEMCDQGLGDVLREGGKGVFSGIIEEQADDVEAALRRAGLEPYRRRVQGDWVVIEARKPPL